MKPSQPVVIDSIGDLHRSVQAALRKKARSPRAVLNKRWHKDPNFISYGVSAADYRSITRQYAKVIKGLSLPDRLALAERLIRSGVEEEATFANGILSLSTAELTPSELSFVDHYAEHLHSWSSTDDLSIHVLQPLLLKCPTPVLRMLERWSRSGLRWKRRASIVVFVRRVAAQGTFADRMLSIADRLAWDQDEMVQKGLGWALKDNLRGDREKILPYLRRLREAGAPARVVHYGIKELKAPERAAIVSIETPRTTHTDQKRKNERT